jgi:hypothetical protein
MHPHPPIQPQPLGRTAAIAGGVLAVVAVCQMSAVGVAFFKNMRGGADAAISDGGHNPPLKIDVSKLVAESPPPETPDSLGPDPLTLPENAAPSEAAPEAPKPPPAVATAVTKNASPRPTPGPLSTFTPKTDPHFSELIEQGKLLRSAGDTAGALVKFREAAALEPGNALAIAEQAFTFEKMSLPEKAAEQWRRIIAMGDRAGVYYSAARAKLETAVQGTMRQTAGGNTPIAEGKTLSIGGATLRDDPDPAAAKKFTLAVPIRSRPNEPISVRDLKLFVLFYERINGKDIVRTTANVSNRWTSPPADWTDGDTETLEVSYDLPASTAAADHREYHGYVVRLYYRGELQDTTAEPANLNQKFPAPYTISE